MGARRGGRYEVGDDGVIVEKKSDELKKSKSFKLGKKGKDDIVISQPVFNEHKTLLEKNNMLKDNVVLSLVSPRADGAPMVGHARPVPIPAGGGHGFGSTQGPVIVGGSGVSAEELAARQAAQRNKLQALLGAGSTTAAAAAAAHRTRRW